MLNKSKRVLIWCIQRGHIKTDCPVALHWYHSGPQPMRLVTYEVMTSWKTYTSSKSEKTIGLTYWRTNNRVSGQTFRRLLSEARRRLRCSLKERLYWIKHVLDVVGDVTIGSIFCLVTNPCFVPASVMIDETSHTDILEKAFISW